MTRARIIAGLIGVVVCLAVFKIAHLVIKQPGRNERIILERLISAEKNWRDAVERRHQYIESLKGLKNFNPWKNNGFTAVLWNLFPPSFDCPYMRKRIGRIGDGGKWMCGFELFETLESSSTPCIVYSFGVSDDSSFESEILDKTNCEVFAYDMTVNQMGSQVNAGNARVHFKKVGLGANDTDNLQTLSSLMAENGHHWIDILKIDIEGAEFGAFDSILNSSFNALPFGQLQLEIHVNPQDISGFYNWFERLESRGLRPFSTEINLYLCIVQRLDPTVMEFSFINVNVSHSLVPSKFVAL